MKYISLIMLAFAVSVTAHAKETVKLSLNFAQQSDLIKALVVLDGSPRLDKDNAQVAIAYDFKGSTRLAIAKDIKTLSDSVQTYYDSWKAYLKGAGIADESKETPEQKQKVSDLLNTSSDVTLASFAESDFVSDDNDKNPIPPTVITRLLPLIRS